MCTNFFHGFVCGISVLWFPECTASDTQLYCFFFQYRELVPPKHRMLFKCLCECIMVFSLFLACRFFNFCFPVSTIIYIHFFWLAEVYFCRSKKYMRGICPLLMSVLFLFTLEALLNVNKTGPCWICVWPLDPMWDSGPLMYTSRVYR